MTDDQIAENRKRWSAELRSGRWQQCTTGDLWVGRKVCALGVYAVACMGIRPGSRQSDELYEAIRKELGLTNQLENDLWNMNDGDELTFAAIADWVDRLPAPTRRNHNAPTLAHG